MKIQTKPAYFAFIALFALMLVLPLTSADAASTTRDFMTSVTNVINAVVEGLSPLFNLLFGPQNEVAVGQGTGSYLLVEILLLIIVFSLVYNIVDGFEFFNHHPWTVWVISIAVSLLSVRFLSDGWVNAILFPYQALGIALTAIIPFIIYFVFVEIRLKDPHGTPFFRRILWIFFGVVFLFMYFSREFGSEGEAPAFIWIYFVTAVVSFIMIWLDGSVQRWMVLGRVSRAHSKSTSKMIRELKEELRDADRQLKDGIIEADEYRTIVARIRHDIDELSR